MAIPRPSKDDILNRIFNRLKNETPITAGLDSSVIGVILKVIAAEMDLVWEYVEDLNKSSNLSTASGPALDNFGLLFGVPRKQAQNASTLGQTRSIRFTNVGAGSITIPSGSRVYKESNPQIAYFLTEGATLGAGQSVDLHATAAGEGALYNANIGDLNKHSIPNVALQVTNILPITNGSFLESDESYRERILRDIQRRDSLNPSNVDALLRRVPGIKDVFIIDLKRGAGTFDAIIVPYNITSTATVVAEAQRLLDEFIPAGISAVAKSPQYRQLDIQIVLRFDPKTGAAKDAIKASIKDQILARIDNLPIEDGSGNGTFYTPQIRGLALVADKNVLDASVVLGLDGSPIASEGEIRLGIGQRLILRKLTVN